METIIILSCIVIFFLAAFPLKNYLVIKRQRKQEQRWMQWVGERPSKEAYCKAHNLETSNPTCDYCGSNRQYPSLEMVIPFSPKFGLISNSSEKYIHFKTYICGRCGTELFRGRHEA